MAAIGLNRTSVGLKIQHPQFEEPKQSAPQSNQRGIEKEPESGGSSGVGVPQSNQRGIEKMLVSKR